MCVLRDPEACSVEAEAYFAELEAEHDAFLSSFFDAMEGGGGGGGARSYRKLYSYSHVLNGFAVQISAEKVKKTQRNRFAAQAESEGSSGEGEGDGDGEGSKPTTSALLLLLLLLLFPPWIWSRRRCCGELRRCGRWSATGACRR
jgi:hypothetical protein